MLFLGCLPPFKAKTCEDRDLGIVHRSDAQPGIYLVFNNYLTNEWILSMFGWVSHNRILFFSKPSFKSSKGLLFVVIFSNKRKRSNRVRIKALYSSRVRGWHNRKWSIVIYFSRTYYTVDFMFEQNTQQRTDKFRVGRDVWSTMIQQTVWSVLVSW